MSFEESVQYYNRPIHIKAQNLTLGNNNSLQDSSGSGCLSRENSCPCESVNSRFSLLENIVQQNSTENRNLHLKTLGLLSVIAKDISDTVFTQQDESHRSDTCSTQQDDTDRSDTLTTQQDDADRSDTLTTQQDDTDRPDTLTTQQDDADRPDTVFTQQDDADRSDTLFTQQDDDGVTDRYENIAPDRLEKVFADRLEKVFADRLEKMFADRLEKMITDRLATLITQQDDDGVTGRYENIAPDRLEKVFADRLEKMITDRLDTERLKISDALINRNNALMKEMDNAARELRLARLRLDNDIVYDYVNHSKIKNPFKKGFRRLKQVLKRKSKSKKEDGPLHETMSMYDDFEIQEQQSLYEGASQEQRPLSEEDTLERQSSSSDDYLNLNSSRWTTGSYRRFASHTDIDESYEHTSEADPSFKKLQPPPIPTIESLVHIKQQQNKIMQSRYSLNNVDVL